MIGKDLYSTWSLFLVLPLLLILLAATLRVQTDLSAFIVAGENADEMLLASEMQSGKLSRRYLLSVVADNDRPVSEDFARQLLAGLAKIQGVEQVWDTGSERVALSDLIALYLPYPGNFYARGAENLDWLSESALKQRAAGLKQALLSPEGAAVKQLAVRDPLLLTLQGFKALTKKPNASTYRENFTSIVLDTRKSGLEFAAQKQIQQTITDLFERLKQAGDYPYTLEMTGVPIFAVHTQGIIERDITRVSLLSTLVLTMLFWTLFRSLSTMFQVLVILATAILTALLVTNSIFAYVHGMTIAIGTTLIGVCIDYPIHALVHARQAASEKRVAVVARLWPSMLLGGATTMVGYSALGFSGYPGFQQVAVYAATGILVALLLTRFVLPRMMPRGQQQYRVVGVNTWLHFCQRRRLLLMAGLLVVVTASLLGLKSLHWISELQDLTPELRVLQEQDRRVRSRMASIEPGRFVLVTGENTEEALQRAEQAYQVLDQLKSENRLDDYYGLYPWIISAKQQRENLRQLQMALTGDVRDNWLKALQEQGLSLRRLGHLDYSGNNVMSVEEVIDSPVGRLLDSQIVIADGRTLLLIWLGYHQPDALASAFADMEGLQYFSQRELLNRMTAKYRQRTQTMLLSGVGIILLLLALRYRNLLRTVQTLLPAIIASLIVLGIWSLTGQALSFLHLVGFLLVVALCVDYGIFFQENRVGDRQLTYQAMAASMLTSAAAFACLLSAETALLRTLAAVVTLGVVLGFLLCPIVIGPESGQKHKV